MSHPYLDRMQAKWDSLAAPQLRAELERMEKALADANQRIIFLEDVAESWRHDCLNAIAFAGAEPGLTIDGALVPVSATQ